MKQMKREKKTLKNLEPQILHSCRSDSIWSIALDHTAKTEKKPLNSIYFMLFVSIEYIIYFQPRQV